MLKIVTWRGVRAALAGVLLALGLVAPGLTAAAQAAPAGSAAQSAAHAQSAAFKLGPDVKQACAPSTKAGVASCSALLSTVQPAGDAARAGVLAAAAPVGYSPANLQSAYGLQSGSEGMRQTVAIVVAFDDPSAEADLSVYRAQYGLPPCTTADGCFQKVDLSSSPVNNAGWAAEAAVDMDTVSAICPECHIMLVESQGDDIPDLGSAVDTAVTDGAKFVSNSYYTPESAAEVGATGYDQYYNHPGVAITASAGDNGYGVSYPAASPYVTAVGGTVLTAAATARRWTETAWSGTGSGCSAYEPASTWQAAAGCSARLDNDVAAVAASASTQTPVAYYDSFDADGWGEAGGTSVSAAVIAGVYALAGTPAAGSNPASFPYRFPGLLNPVTSGSNGTCSVTSWCTAGTGYDGPTGNGTPAAVNPFTSTGTVSGVIYSGTVGMCMDNTGNKTTNGNPVEIERCDNVAAQHWTANSDGRFETNGMCLGVNGGQGAALGSNVWSWNCSSGGAKWLVDTPQRLTDTTANVCLGLKSTTGVAGTQLTINTCNATASQQWTLPYPVPTSTGSIAPKGSSAVCIGLNNSSSTGAATLFGCDGNTAQTWTIEGNGTVRDGQSNCLDVHDGGATAGTEVDHATCSGGTAQQWRVEPDGSLLHPASGMCMAPKGNSLATGTSVVMEPCSFTAIQEWNLST